MSHINQNNINSTVAKLFVKNFHDKLTREDIANAIRGVDIGSVYSVQIRTSRRNVHHAVVEIIWDDTSSTSQFLQGLLKTGKTVRISLNSNHPDSYIEMVEYQEEIDTKTKTTHSRQQLTQESAQKTVRSYEFGQGASRQQLTQESAQKTVRSYEFGSGFAQYGEKMLRTIGIY